MHKIIESIRTGRFIYKIKRKIKYYFNNVCFFLRLSWLIRPMLQSKWNAQKLVFGDNNRNFTCFGWETVDLLGADYIVDFRDQKLPFPESSVELVYCSHMIEHVSDDSAAIIFTEVYRVLKPGGVFRLVCPDLDKVLKAYKENNIDFFLKPYGLKQSSKVGFGDTKEGLLLHNNFVRILASYASDGAGPIVSKELVDKKLQECNRYEFAKWCVSLLESQRANQKCIWGHVNAYDFPKLKLILQNSGFSDITNSSFRASSVKELRKHCFDHKSKEWMSLYTEAIKTG